MGKIRLLRVLALASPFAAAVGGLARQSGVGQRWRLARSLESQASRCGAHTATAKPAAACLMSVGQQGRQRDGVEREVKRSGQ